MLAHPFYSLHFSPEGFKLLKKFLHASFILGKKISPDFQEKSLILLKIFKTISKAWAYLEPFNFWLFPLGHFQAN